MLLPSLPLWRPCFSTSAFASPSAVFSFTEGAEAVRRTAPLSHQHVDQRRRLYPHSVSSSPCGHTVLGPGSGSAGPHAPTSVPSQILRDTSSAVIPNPSASSSVSSDWPCLPLGLHFLLPCYSKTPWNSLLADAIPFLPLSLPWTSSNQTLPSSLSTKSQPHFVVAPPKK